MRKTSATAVPLSFRGFGSPRVGSDVGTTTPSGRPASSTSIPIPFLAHHGRRASTGAHTPAVTPSRSPVSPQHPPATDPSASSSSTWTPPLPAPSLTTSPVRHKKVPSTEFKGGTFRPLYLVERNASRRRGSAPNTDAEPELLPMLPSSRSPSVSQDSSEEWASAVEDNNDDDDSFASAGASGYASATEGVEEQPRDLRNAGLRIDTGASMAQADLLDSQQSTPRAGAFGLGVKDQDVDVPARAAERLAEVEREEKERGEEKEKGMSVGEMAAAAVTNRRWVERSAA
ncbi:involucrin repeat protein [Neofusicoccum parvum]|uniref:Involucrin repeat protein n=1 Tax=Neofusicoccum parvum TaxID=310453 RepID=A0ACB5SJ25_9PEZI|nr:involucrin repeat protein [Neofusicoccum parvum]